MNNMNLSDTEIEIFLFGKWRFNTDWEKIYIEFKDDMTYEQTRIQTFLLSKPSEFITGNKFTGVWHVNDKRLCLIVKTVPKSFFNLRLLILSKVDLADMIASIFSIFITETYEVIEINKLKFIINHKNQIIAGTKIK
ncbi:hypothetical protein [Nostoc sp. 'Lobaria pulmonaria (5183) cyanobiont']|uniref:hypothetical protein n=1 Tax=Nostoc sp. 'Lobaria pulmonaria (5183) cyanobiont' TaxID=1618022 RepID=UPI000D0C3AD1|nr:hypothetical protein [Nostoc sp. 'Lobaria pulmonaria (5183) cyanobiont']AVH71148.1 hypothetical protein NLP_2471 [Nostoc sp. 'Lobaria pulmonaria (5183) cyanobiont']